MQDAGHLQLLRAAAACGLRHFFLLMQSVCRLYWLEKQPAPVCAFILFVNKKMSITFTTSGIANAVPRKTLFLTIGLSSLLASIVSYVVSPPGGWFQPEYVIAVIILANRRKFCSSQSSRYGFAVQSTPRVWAIVVLSWLPLLGMLLIKTGLGFYWGCAVLSCTLAFSLGCLYSVLGLIMISSTWVYANPWGQEAIQFCSLLSATAFLVSAAGPAPSEQTAL